MKAISLVLVTAACIVPHKSHTTRRLSHVIGAPIEDPSVLVVRSDGGMLHVRALRVCRAHASDLVEDTTHVTADFIGVSAMPRRTPADPVDAPQGDGKLAAVVLAVTGAMTALDIYAEDGKVTARRERAADEQVPCPMGLRKIEVTAELPSGRRSEAVTDDTGAAELAIPGDEPAGDIVVRAPGMEPRSVAFSPTRP